MVFNNCFENSKFVALKIFHLGPLKRKKFSLKKWPLDTSLLFFIISINWASRALNELRSDWKISFNVLSSIFQWFWSAFEYKFRNQKAKVVKIPCLWWNLRPSFYLVRFLCVCQLQKILKQKFEAVIEAIKVLKKIDIFFGYI